MNEPQAPLELEEAAAYEFPSLAVMKAAHLKLLERESASGPAFLDDVREFMLRASATGRVLDDDKERGIAQTLLNYWVTVLIRAGEPEEKIPRTTLAELDENAGRDLDDSQCPYRGLDAYSESTAHLFFGRRQVIEEWLGFLREKLLLVVLGPSGSGKTSLIRAGLLPALRAGRLPGSEKWKVVETTLPGEDPESALRATLEGEAKSSQVLLVVHRLDEVFSHCKRKTQRELMTAIAQWVSAPGAQRRAITAARLESAGALTQWVREAAWAKITKEAFIPPFGARELRAVIEEPAEQIGLRFEEGIVDTLINEFLGDPAALTLLQFTLIKLWDRRERNHITWAAYREIGGGQGAVETTAEAVYGGSDFDDADRELTRKIFLRLVRPSLTRELVANSLPEAALSEDDEGRNRVRKIAERFEKAQLLRVRTDSRGERLLEVTHEALLRKWPRLLQWLDDSRIELLQRQRIGMAAAQWREQGRDPSTLWTGVLLTAALSIKDQLSPSELEFVEASRRAADRRRNRKIALLTAVIVLLGLGLLREMRRTLQERFVGREIKAALNLERGERLLESGDASGAFLFFQRAVVDDPNANNDLPYRAWRLFIFPQGSSDGSAESNELVHRRRLGATWRQLPRLQDLFGLKELSHGELSPSGDYLVGTSQDAVRVWRVGEDGEAGSRDPLAGHPHGKVLWASFHPDPKQPLIAIVTSDPDVNGRPSRRGEIVVFDAQTNRLVGDPIRFEDGAPQKAWFNPGEAHGDLLLIIRQPTGGSGGEIAVWNFRNGRQEAVLRDHQLPVNWASFSPNGNFVITAAGDLDGGERGEARVWDWKNNRSAALPHDGGPIRYAEFASVQFDDGSLHALTAEGASNSNRGSARVWSVLPRETAPYLQVGALTAPLSHRAEVNRARFSPNGLWVATASSDGTAKLWHVRTQREALDFRHDGDVIDVAFSPDGRFLVTAGRDRTARVWEVATGKPAQAPFNHSETVIELAYSRDGRSIVTTSKHLARIWAANRDEPKAPLLKASNTILAAMSGDGQRLLTVSKPDEHQEVALELWQTKTGALLAAAKLTDSQSIGCAALNQRGDRIVVASQSASQKDTALHFFELTEGNQAAGEHLKKTKELRTNVFFPDEVLSAAFDSSGQKLGLVLRKPGDKESRVALCEVTAGTVQILPGQEPSFVSRILFSPTGKYLLACFTRPGEPEGRAMLWALGNNSSAPSELHHSTAITSAAFSPDEHLLLTGSTDDNARLWPITDDRLSSSELLHEKGSDNTHTADLTQVAFSPDGQRALTASKDQTAVLWNLTDGPKRARRVAVLRHGAYVNSAVFSARGDLILTSSGEPKLRAWSAANGELLARFTPPSEVSHAGFAPDGNSIFAIGKISGTRTQAEATGPDQAAPAPALRAVRPVAWSFAPLQGSLQDVGRRGMLLAARRVGEKSLEKADAENLRKTWGTEKSEYNKLFAEEPEPRQYHLAAADECEATKQWYAAAWHLTKLLELTADDPSRAELLLRRAEAYAAADNWADSLPKCISDRKSAIDLGRNSAEDYRALAAAHLDYGNASGKPEEWDFAVDVLRESLRLHPDDARSFRLLGEALAGKRDYVQAEEAFQQALALGDDDASARLALIGWIRNDEFGKQLYRNICLSLYDPSIEGSEARSLLWPSVLTNAFESDERYKPFLKELVRRAQESSAQEPSNLYRRNTFGAALYRAGNYEEAIKELEAARAANLAERANALSQYYDRMLRIPISRTPEGRPQDWAFLAMANARLNRRSEAWDWIRKLRDSPELARAVQQRKRDYPVSYETLALELLYDEALDVVRKPSVTP